MDPIEIFIDQEIICLKKSEYSTNYLNELKLLRENLLHDAELQAKDEILMKISELINLLENTTQQNDKK